jgi:hypothetical protein
MPRYVMCLLVTVLLVVPSAASAVTTAVTAPANGARFIDDAANPPTVHLAGTADVASVDLLCVSSQGGSPGVGTIPIKTNVAVTSGAWSTDAQWPSNASSMCEIYAVDHGSVPLTNSDLNGLGGAKVYPAYFNFTKAANNRAYNYYATMSAPGGYYDFGSFGYCTMDFGQLLSPSLHEYDGSIFDCNGYAEGSDPTDTTKDSTLVDGKPAYSTYAIGSDSARAALPGWTPLTMSIADDAGSWHLTSHEGIFRCANSDTFPPDSCTAWQDSGVGLDVDERQSTDGRTLTQILRFTNATAQAHTLSVVLDQLTVDPRQWFFPGTAGFQGYSTNEAPSVIAPGVATIRNQLNSPNPESILKGVGGITYTTTPSAEQFVTNGDVFVQKYTNLSIPAGGTTRLEFIYTMDDTAAHLDARIGSAESSFGAPPAITVTSSANATSAAYTLTGTVNAPEGVNGLTVNNAPVAVASNGSFSLPETLANGANAFTLAATDELGRTSTTPFSVTLSSAVSPNNIPLAVRFGRSGKPKLKGRTLTTGATASCPGTGPDCSIAAAASVGRKKAGSGKATVRAGTTARLKVKLTKAGAKLFKRTHRLTLKLNGRRTGAATTSASQMVKLPTKRKR